MRRDVLARRQEREHRRHRLRRALEQRGHRRRAGEVFRHRHAIGLHDEHAPVAPVGGGNVGLLRHQVVEARHAGQRGGDAKRLAPDVGPGRSEAAGGGKVMRGFEHGRRMNAAVVEPAHRPDDVVVECHGVTSLRAPRQSSLAGMFRRGNIAGVNFGRGRRRKWRSRCRQRFSSRLEPAGALQRPTNVQDHARG
jgi:hypothetical protein